MGSAGERSHPSWRTGKIDEIQRSPASLKNKFYWEIRKTHQLLNRLGARVWKKGSKPLKYQALVKILNIAQGGEYWAEEIQQLAQELRGTLFQLILSFGKEDIENISEFMEKILEFNIKTRHYAIAKKRNPKSKTLHLESDPAKGVELGREAVEEMNYFPTLKWVDEAPLQKDESQSKRKRRDSKDYP